MDDGRDTVEKQPAYYILRWKSDDSLWGYLKLCVPDASYPDVMNYVRRVTADTAYLCVGDAAYAARPAEAESIIAITNATVVEYHG